MFVSIERRLRFDCKARPIPLSKNQNRLRLSTELLATRAALVLLSCAALAVLIFRALIELARDAFTSRAVAARVSSLLPAPPQTICVCCNRAPDKFQGSSFMHNSDTRNSDMRNSNTRNRRWTRGIWLVLALVAAAPAHGAISLVQHPAPCQTLAGTSQACTFANPTAAANFVAVAVSSFTAGAITVSDNQGNAYSQAGATQTTAGNGLLQIFFAANIVGGASHSVTAAGTASGFITLAVYEYAGVQTSPSPLDQANGATGSDASAVTRNVTTATPGELYFAAETDDANATTTAGNGFTLEDSIVTGQGLSTEDKVDVAQTTQGIFNLSAATNWAAAIATFAPATGGGGVQPQLPSLGCCQFDVNWVNLVSWRPCAAADPNCSFAYRVCDSTAPPKCLDLPRGSVTLAIMFVKKMSSGTTAEQATPVGNVKLSVISP